MKKKKTKKSNPIIMFYFFRFPVNENVEYKGRKVNIDSYFLGSVRINENGKQYEVPIKDIHPADASRVFNSINSELFPHPTGTL